MPKVSRVHLLEERSMPWSGELLIPRSERESFASNASSTSKRDHRARRSGELIPQNERETQTLRRERHAQR